VKQTDIARDPQLAARLMPSGSIEEQDGVTALRHLAADLFEMQVHRVGVGIRQDQGRAGIATRADGADAGFAVYLRVGSVRHVFDVQPLPLLYRVEEKR